jgi:hypothetical protein
MNYKKVIFGTLVLFSGLLINAQSWKSSLYPENWYPGFKNETGQFLHDFSYAGYHAGEKNIPFITNNIIDVTLPPFNADSTGINDATSVIQAAIDSAGKIGGGVVYLPTGTYKISVGSQCALWIKYSNVILRGAGSDKTFVLNTQQNIRQKHIILVKPASGGDWYSPETTANKFTSDIKNQDSTVIIDDVSNYSVGDWVVITTDVTAGFIADHKMTGLWNSTLPGVAFYRQIKSINESTGKITLDAPVKYYLKTRDNARMYKVNKHLEEVGIENLSLGSVQNITAGMADMDYNVSTTGAYQVHASQVISFYYTVNSWMKNVSTYKPSSNSGNFHINSNGLLLEKSRYITIDSCFFGFSQYEGEGGNGYMYTLRSNDCLIKNSIGDNGRHNFDFKSMFSSGNVILRCTGKDPRFASDFHMHLSISNLIDNYTVNGDLLEAAYRPYGTIQHGQTTTESVFWNTYGIKGQGGSSTIIKSQQWGFGYIIGTQGTVTGVSTPGGNNTEPIDFKEGIGKGATLEPASLYEDQLKKRLEGYTYPSVEVKTNSLNQSKINVYPIPAKNTLYMTSNTSIAGVEIYNINGSILYTRNQINNTTYNIELNELVPGYYLLKVITESEIPYITSFVKN